MRTKVSERAAREILRRASELDQRGSESVDLETLRAAAREAGISEFAVSAALREYDEGAIRDRAKRARRRMLIGTFAGAGVAFMMLFVLSMLIRIGS
jgi:hypothetical protein